MNYTQLGDNSMRELNSNKRLTLRMLSLTKLFLREIEEQNQDASFTDSQNQSLDLISFR